jgi:hypothetical protein
MRPDGGGHGLRADRDRDSDSTRRNRAAKQFAGANKRKQFMQEEEIQGK